jgi:hypothetical protein
MSGLLGNLFACEPHPTIKCIRELTALTPVLPPSLLGKWQLIVASAAVFNTVQNFVTLKFTRRIYNNVPPTSGTRHSSLGASSAHLSPVTALQARTFGVWTLTSAVVRFYAAFHIHEKAYVLDLRSSRFAANHSSGSQNL